MSEQEITTLVEQFNQAEKEQVTRAQQLYDLLADQRTGGARYVRFAGDCMIWGGSAFQRGDRRDLAYHAYVAPLERTITEIKIGEPV
ncbi:MAG: hypothetical protein HN975_16680 [Anaerolineae bacterium]|jgi:hypothetical protein|nr:hypothetical protein [Anaerolineae bacterium]